MQIKDIPTGSYGVYKLVFTNGIFMWANLMI